jgi:hypothetical protein
MMSSQHPQLNRDNRIHSREELPRAAHHYSGVENDDGVCDESDDSNENLSDDGDLIFSGELVTPKSGEILI